MVARHLETVLRRLSRQLPVVTLTGPRQSGKTTLVRQTFPRHEYVSLEDPDEREHARTDPRGFLNRFQGDVILDEVQRTPALMSYLQGIVDREDRPGRFVLTGSQNFLLLEGVSQTLAGRTAILHLLPFSLSEIEARPDLALDRLGETVPAKSRHLTRDLAETLFRGFYPRIHDKDLDPERWYRDYYQTYVERDVRELVNVGDMEAFGRFVRLCAGRNGQILNLSSLGADCGITHTTARRWVSILESSFLVHLLRPHHRNFSKRLIKSPKLYFLDTGLVCYLLGIRTSRDLRTHSMRGPIFESFVVSELMKSSLHRGDESRLFFWRDTTGHEVDVVFERGERLVSVEIKSGETIAADAFRGLGWFRELAKDASERALLIYGGDRSYYRDKALCLSWTCF